MKTPTHLDHPHPKRESSNSPVPQLAKKPYSTPTVEEAGSVFSRTKSIVGGQPTDLLSVGSTGP